MGIHTRRPQDPPDMPKITIGSGPGMPPEGAGARAELPAGQVARAAVEAIVAGDAAGHPLPARPEASAPGSAATRGARADPEGTEARSPRRATWLVTLLASVLPMAASVVAPPSATPVLLGIGGALILVGVVLYFRR